MKRRTRLKLDEWSLWAGAAAVSFAALETRAIRKGGVTLTAWTKTHTGQGDASRRDRKLWAAALGGFLFWFWTHIVLGVGPYVTPDGGLTMRRPK